MIKILDFVLEKEEEEFEKIKLIYSIRNFDERYFTIEDIFRNRENYIFNKKFQRFK